ncbi:MAG: MBL fold metallo-hydrolase, partial [Planctomycetota bacterium]
DILEPAMAMQGVFDYYSHTKHARPIFDKLIATEPEVLACMHGAAWRGNGAALLGALADKLV